MSTEAPVIDACDECVKSIAAVWTRTNEDSLEQAFLVQLPRETLRGRHVWVYPLEYGETAASREILDASGEAIRLGKVGITMAERWRYADTPETIQNPAGEWVRERIKFFWETIYKTFRANLPTLEGTVTVSDQIKTVVDLDFLEAGVFWSEAEFEFRWIG